jgi:hypothetical protein
MERLAAKRGMMDLRSQEQANYKAAPRLTSGAGIVWIATRLAPRGGTARVMDRSRDDGGAIIG